MSSWLEKFTRKKCIENEAASTETSLRRCLGTGDLTLMGIGSMVGSGIYVLTGIAAKDMAGPGIVLSFIGAALTVLLVALCFIEFAARVPRTGSSYLYMYFSLGELPAFLMGWTTILACITGGATNARAWSSYLDFLFNGQVANYTETHVAKWDIGSPIADYPDFMAVGMMLIVTFVVSMGANCSSKFNAVFVSVNISILLFVIIVGFVYADLDNWTNTDRGGFLPFKFVGVLHGAAACFWAMTGFEIIAVSVEETKNPGRSIPIATLLALFIVTTLYVGTASAVTLVTSYQDIDREAPLPSAFANRGLTWAKYIVSIGPLFGLTTTLMSSLFSFVRITYAMSVDGLLFMGLSTVNRCSQVPVISVTIGGVIMAFVACFFNVKDILGFGVLLSLLQYILIAASVIILRYKPSQNPVVNVAEPSTPKKSSPGEVRYAPNGFIEASDSACSDDENYEVTLFTKSNGTHSAGDSDRRTLRLKLPSTLPISQTLAGELDSRCGCLRPCVNYPAGHCVFVSVLLLLVTISLLVVTLFYGGDMLLQSSWWVIVTVVALVIFIVVLLGCIVVHRQNLASLKIKVPCVPLIPCLAMLACIILMVSVSSVSSWVGLLITFSMGLVVYCGYGVRYSKENHDVVTTELESAAVALLPAHTDEDLDSDSDEL